MQDRTFSGWVQDSDFLDELSSNTQWLDQPDGRLALNEGPARDMKGEGVMWSERRRRRRTSRTDRMTGRSQEVWLFNQPQRPTPSQNRQFCLLFLQPPRPPPWFLSFPRPRGLRLDQSLWPPSQQLPRLQPQRGAEQTRQLGVRGVGRC